MKIRLLSDLHTEFSHESVKNLPYGSFNSEDVLVLAGDIAVGAKNTIKVLQDFHAVGFEKIIYVAGNHEYYGSSIDEFNTELQNFSKSNSWVTFLQDSWTVVDSTVFIGTTLWTNFGNNPVASNAAQYGISDFSRIKGFNTAKCADLNNKAEAFLKSALIKLPELFPEKKVVVVTHFLPAKACIAPMYRGPGDSLLNSYFANHLDDYLLDHEREITWCFGHTHTPTDISLNNVRLVCNPRGYPGYESRNGFEPLKTL